MWDLASKSISYKPPTLCGLLFIFSMGDRGVTISLSLLILLLELHCNIFLVIIIIDQNPIKQSKLSYLNGLIYPKCALCVQQQSH
jgi:hypothetical protein